MRGARRNSSFYEKVRGPGMEELISIALRLEYIHL